MNSSTTTIYTEAKRQRHNYQRNQRATPARNRDSLRRPAATQTLSLWKQAVALAGAQYFDTPAGLTPAQARSREQLRPNGKNIERALATLSPSAGLFLCVLYSLYDRLAGEKLTARYFPGQRSLTHQLEHLDGRQREVVEMLLLSHTDW